MKNLILLSILVISQIAIKAQTYTISTIGGNGTGGYSGDGAAATSAELNLPVSIALDNSGDIYIADNGNERIRKINSSGIISNVAGNGSYSYSGDGEAATSADLCYPFGVAVDATGNIYIADECNERIRMVNTSGDISTVAGNGGAAFSGDGAAATSATLYGPFNVTVDASGNLYIADINNQRIRKVNTSGIISTIAGNGDGAPNGGNYSGDGGAATSAALYNPYGIAVDVSGNVYIADQANNRIRKVNTSGIISTIAGNGNADFSGDGGAATSAELNSPYGVAVDAAGNVYIADQSNNRIRKVNSKGIISTIAGNGTRGYSGDGGVSTAAELTLPSGIAFDKSGNILIADQFNNRIRKLTKTTTGINELSESEYVKIYPNPNKGVFTIEIQKEQLENSNTLEIYNMLGEKIYSTLLPKNSGSASKEINLANTSKGIYLYRITGENGELTSSGKLVLQ